MIAIDVNKLTKTYKLYKSPKDRLRELLSLNRKKYHHDYFALNDVSFAIEKGQTVGIIGQNGSGKSTLLKIICGVVRPTSGSVNVNGRIASLLELGAGFNPEFTGRENVYMNGALMGFSRVEIERRMPEIEVFADIGEFIDQPVKSYSSGMYVRLAFAAAINVDPDILIIDEALSVGDVFFQSKCITKMKKMIENGITLLFVTHNMGAVKSLCKKSLLLNHGKLIDYSSSDTIVEKYFALKVGSEQTVISVDNDDFKSLGKLGDTTVDENWISFNNNAEFKRRATYQRIQNGKAHFINVQLLGNSGQDISIINYEQKVILRMAVEVLEDLEELSFGYHIRDNNGVDIVYSDSVIENKNLHYVKKGDKFLIDWTFKVSLKHGQYNIACVLSTPENTNIGKVTFCDFVPLSVQFTMMLQNESPLFGSIHWENLVDIKKHTVGEKESEASHRVR